MIRSLFSFYLLYIISTRFCNGQEGYRYGRPISMAFPSASSDKQLINGDRNKINADTVSSNYSSHRYKNEISDWNQNSTIPHQKLQLAQFFEPATRAWNSAATNLFSEMLSPSSTKSFLDSETDRLRIIFGPLNLSAENSNFRPSIPALTVELIESNDKSAPQLESSVSNYPTLSKIPTTKFSCDSQKHSGYFADVETHCQVFHICANGLKYDYVCPSETVFDQRYLICTRRNRFNCSTAESLYDSKENLYDEEEMGSLVGHAAGTTGAQGPSAVYIPLTGIFPAPILHSDSHIESKGPFYGLKQSTETNKYLEVLDESSNARNESTDNKTSHNRHLSPSVRIGNQSVSHEAHLNLSDSLSRLTYSLNSQNVTTTPEPSVAVVPFFTSTFKSTIRSPIPSNHEPVFSLHGQLIPYRAPFEPEKTTNFMRTYGSQEPENNLKSSSRLPRPFTPYEPSSQLEGSGRSFKTLTDNRELMLEFQSIFKVQESDYSGSGYLSSFPKPGDQRDQNGPRRFTDSVRFLNSHILDH